MPDFVSFRMNKGLCDEVIRVRYECLNGDFKPKQRRLSVKTVNANNRHIRYQEWIEHINNASKVDNIGNLKLDLKFDYTREKPQPERKPLTQEQKDYLKSISFKLMKRERTSIPVLESVAA
jgi:hypothetical protein